MQPVAVRILHPAPAGIGPLERALLDARALNADRLALLFREAGAEDVQRSQHRDAEPADAEVSFGARLRAELAGVGDGGLVVLGSGAIPLATLQDVRAFVEVAAVGGRRALANNRYSADVVALGEVEAVRAVPDLPGDNALPRWLDEVAAFEVADLRSRWHLAMDLDSPLDVVLSGGILDEAIDVAPVRLALEGVRAVAADRRAELLVAGRTSAATLAWLEASTAARVRALVEERGLRASSPAALGGGPPAARRSRPPRSVLGLLLDDRGPEALGANLAELADAAAVDTRVLLAHRLGAEERRWPDAEDRFASDLLLPDRVRDPWLRDLTASVCEAAIPILLGGHSLVGPGIRLALGGRPA
ncbi:MAG TPA: hypothetical protein VF494_07100 [Candidatus Limnocylindrales bacterium]